jgi:hypothetical protein
MSNRGPQTSITETTASVDCFSAAPPSLKYEPEAVAAEAGYVIVHGR